MNDILLVVETGADVPVDVARELNIHIVPMHVEFEDETFDDGAFPTEKIVEFYQRSRKLPKTSGCTPHDFELLFDELQSKFPDSEILYLAYSAITTCSYQSAVIAAEGREHITLIDTRQVSAGQGMIAMTLARMLKEQPDMMLAQAVEAANDLIARANMCFLPDNLEFLRAGGRCNNAAAIVGSLLKLKPCIEILEGKLLATKKYRGHMDKVIDQLIREYAEQYRLERDCLWIVYTVGLGEEVRRAAEAAAKDCGFAEVCWVRAGGVITTHGGPAAIGMAGFSAK